MRSYLKYGYISVRMLLLMTLVILFSCSREWTNPMDEDEEIFAQIPTDGLIAYYPFNGNAVDESRNGIQASIFGPILTADRFGNTNSAYYFDGQDDYLEADASNLPTAERTISLWFFAEDVDNRPGILGYGGSSTHATSWFMGLNINGRKSYHMSCHYMANSIDYYYGTIPINSWIHWVITISTKGTTIYVDGVKEESNSTYIDDTYVANKELGIGVIASASGNVPYSDSNVRYFKGVIDDIRIYDRALSDDEIQILYLEQ